MRTGKLPPGVLADLLARLPAGDPRIRIAPRPGEDAAAIDVDESTLVVTTDPVTFTSADAARYAVHVNANDIAAMGAEPAWLALTVLLPPHTSEEQTRRLFDQIAAACAALDIRVVTGHTEVTAAVKWPVLVGTMLGVAARGTVVGSDGARPGDSVILAGAVAIEGTAILARQAAGALRAAGLPHTDLAAAGEFLDDPGISVVAAARAIRSVCRPHALHDATEGGVATALREVAIASGVALTIDAARLPLRPETRRVCAALGLDPLGLIASGCLIAVVEDAHVDACLNALGAARVEAASAGRAVAGSGVWLSATVGEAPMPEFDRDELARYLDDVAFSRARGRAPTSRSSASRP